MCKTYFSSIGALPLFTTFMNGTINSGSVAERSKALVLGTSLFGGVGSNPTAAIRIFYKREAPSLSKNNDPYFLSNSHHYYFL